MTAVLEPETDVIEATPEEWRSAIHDMLDRIGLTYEQLRVQAEDDDFTSVAAKKAWLVVGGRLSRYAEH